MSRLFALLARLSRRFAEHLEATRSIEIALGADRGLTNAGHRTPPPRRMGAAARRQREHCPVHPLSDGGGVDLG